LAPLPIDALIPGILDHLRAATTLVLEAPPGAGKTTRVPAALLGLDPREVLVLEPRRLAARLAARFVAAERNEPVGASVGYQVRFEEVAGPRTRLRFLTEGVLTRRLLSDPQLAHVACVVLDEFHERHLEGDLALALLRRLQRTSRPDLRLVVMSATLFAGPIAEYLGGARVLRSEGRQYPLAIEYTPHSPAPLETQVAAALERLHSPAGHDLQGHALVFLPGAAEIRRAQTACAPGAQRHGWNVLPLYGDQSPEQQDRALAPSAQPKIILSTNVAESSITIEGVTAVIDSGLARIASHSPWSGLPTLQIARISQASANQRAGRAGRTAPGRAIRLYPLEDFVRRAPQDTPEIQRADLAPTALGQPEERPCSLAEALDQPGLGQQLQMARDARLRLAQDIGEVGNGQFGLGQKGKHAQARFLAGRLEGGIEGIEAELRAIAHCSLTVDGMGLFPLHKDIFIHLNERRQVCPWKVRSPRRADRSMRGWKNGEWPS